MDRLTPVLMAVGMVATLGNFVMMLLVSKAMADIKAYIADTRRTDTESLHEWVEARFQRRLEAPRA